MEARKVLFVLFMSKDIIYPRLASFSYADEDNLDLLALSHPGAKITGMSHHVHSFFSP